MTHQNFHIPDETLLLSIDGELSKRDEQQMRAHLATCWSCRTRHAELEGAIADFVHLHQRRSEGDLPPAEGPRALLQARLAELSRKPSSQPVNSRFPRWVLAAAASLALLTFATASFRWWRRPVRPRDRAAVLVLPDSRLTPGATVLAGRLAVCAEPDLKNKSVPVALQKEVFDEYGIAGADPGAYEVDYLVTPALGGADDIHNLWPHSYRATAWNARVKDKLEDRLRQMVCGGRLDLTAAQREIATNWIAAYKKYFHTDTPLNR